MARGEEVSPTHVKTKLEIRSQRTYPLPPTATPEFSFVFVAEDIFNQYGAVAMHVTSN